MTSKINPSVRTMLLKDALPLLACLISLVVMMFLIGLGILYSEGDSRLKDVNGVESAVKLVWLKMGEAQHAWTHEYDHYVAPSDQPMSARPGGGQTIDNQPR